MRVRLAVTEQRTGFAMDGICIFATPCAIVEVLQMARDTCSKF